jgi:hypothetical protein
LFDREYRKQLESLDAKQVAQEIGPNAIILCWESFNVRCHRRLIDLGIRPRFSGEVKLVRPFRAQCNHPALQTDHTRLPFPRTLASPNWAKFVQDLRLDSVQLHTISYQELLHIAINAVGNSNKKWRDLESWVLEKISAIGESSKT